MEDLKDVVTKRLQDVFSDIKWANNLVEEGKEVPAHRKLQGVRAKLLCIMELVNKQMPDDIPVKWEETTDVAPETTQEI